MVLPRQNELAWKICLTVLHVIALSSAATRVQHRIRIKQSWWDDHIVVVAATSDLILVILFWVQFRRDRSITWDLPDPPFFAFSSWFSLFLGYTTLWFSRISLALSVARLFLSGHTNRCVGFCLSGIFASFYLASVLTSTLLCLGSPWWQLNIPRCINIYGFSFEAFIAVLFVLGFIADIALVLSPLRMFWTIRVAPRQRILLLLLMSSSLLTLGTSLIYCLLYYVAARRGPDSRLLYTALGHLHVSFSLIASNLLVVVTLIYTKSRGFMERRRTESVETSNVCASSGLPAEVLYINRDRHQRSSHVGTLTSIMHDDLSRRSREFISTSVAFAEIQTTIRNAQDGTKSSPL